MDRVEQGLRLPAFSSPQDREDEKEYNLFPYDEEMVGPGIQKIKTWILGCSLRDSVIMLVDEGGERSDVVSPRIRKPALE